MPDKNKKKFIILPIFSVCAIVASAFALYYSSTRYNTFTPGEVKAKVKENESSPEETQSPILQLTSENEQYTTKKEIIVKNDSAIDGYVRIKLIPGWKDGNNVAMATLGTLSNFGNISLDTSKNKIEFANGISCVLADEWNSNWSYDADNDCFTYKKSVPAGDFTTPLITEVIFSDAVYQAALEYEVDFTLDVLADVFQDEGEGLVLRDLYH